VKKFYQAILGLTAVTATVIGCVPGQRTDKCGPCPAIAAVLPNLNFQLVSKTTGNNLFYGTIPQYQLSQLSIHHILNGKPDSVYLRADTATQSFFVFVVPAQHKAVMIDTVVMKIANLSADTLLFNTGVTSGCCPFLLLNSVSYDGTVVYNHSDGLKLVVLQK